MGDKIIKKSVSFLNYTQTRILALPDIIEKYALYMKPSI